MHKKILFIITGTIATLYGMEQTVQPQWLSVTTSDGHQIPLSEELVEKVPIFRAAFDNCMKEQKEKSLALPEISHKTLMSLLPLMHEEIVTPQSTQAVHFATLEARHQLNPELNVKEAAQELIAADYLGLTKVVDSYTKFLSDQAVNFPVEKELVVRLKDYEVLLSNIAKYHFLTCDSFLRKADAHGCVDFNVSLQDLYDHNGDLLADSYYNFNYKNLNSLKNNFMTPEGYASNESLDLDNNNFTEFPQEIALFTNLRTLHLCNNKIKAIPESIAALPYLRKLTLEGNPVESLPQSFTQLTNLKNLSIQNSPRIIAQLGIWDHVNIIEFEDKGTLRVYFKEKDKKLRKKKDANFGSPLGVEYGI